MAAADSLKLSRMATGVNVLAWAELVLGFQLHREEMLSNLAVIFVLILTVASGLLTLPLAIVELAKKVTRRQGFVALGLSWLVLGWNILWLTRLAEL